MMYVRSQARLVLKLTFFYSATLGLKFGDDGPLMTDAIPQITVGHQCMVDLRRVEVDQ